MHNSDLTVLDVVLLMNYERELELFIEENKKFFSKYKLSSLKKEKERISNQIKSL